MGQTTENNLTLELYPEQVRMKVNQINDAQISFYYTDAFKSHGFTCFRSLSLTRGTSTGTSLTRQEDQYRDKSNKVGGPVQGQV